MEQMLQNEPTELSVQAVPQKAVEQACFHALTLISRNCEYLDQHLPAGAAYLHLRRCGQGQADYPQAH